MHRILLQRAVPKTSMPSSALLKKWAKKALSNKIPSGEITIRIVSRDEITLLNATYRKKNKPTNVLSFPFDMPKELNDEIPLLGDIVICADVVNQEARDEGKEQNAHWAHMIIHGTLHLLGYDHENDDDATRMESEEILLLQQLGFNNPYQ